MNIGLGVRRIRSALGLTMAQLSEYAMIPQSTLGAVERGALPQQAEGVMEKVLTFTKMPKGEFEGICARLPSVNQEGESPVTRAVKQQLAARKVLGLPLDD
jgi:transcriptional regulator with XRE-family HTH domain